MSAPQAAQGRLPGYQTLTPRDPVAHRALIFGCEGQDLGTAEAEFFCQADPLGFILFARNCDNPDQLSKLTAALRETVSRDDAPVLIDQEGGRVTRMKPPHWRQIPAAGRFGEMYENHPEKALEAVHLNARLIAHELLSVGVDVDCAPSLDLRLPGASEVIGDRAFSADVETVVALGRAAADGFLAGGVLPVIKHIPGHGRALVDSHLALPVVQESLDVLKRTDFAPFCPLNALPLAMTAHIVYEAIDSQNPGTVSSTVVREVIRDHIGFDGFLISDDLSMEALEGSIEERAARTLAAGADAALHCNGKLDEMKRIADQAPELKERSQTRWQRAREALPRQVEVIDFEAGVAELDRLMTEANL